MDLLFAIITLIISLMIMYFIIKGAVVAALRKARHEERVEKHLPDAAAWLDNNGRIALEKAARSERS